jgi:hypothetical protein
VKSIIQATLVVNRGNVSHGTRLKPNGAAGSDKTRVDEPSGAAALNREFDQQREDSWLMK